MRLSANKILITGASQGIGLELVKAFLGHDNEIIAVSRNLESIEASIAKDQRIHLFPCDLSKSSELDRLILYLEKEHPDLNLLINNAGVQYNYHFMEEINPLSKIEKEVAINLLAPLKLSALCLGLLKMNENAAIINVSSGLGLVPKKNAAVYCATKAGIHLFSKALRDQLNSVKVFEIIPPLVDTQMTAGRGKNKLSPKDLVEEFLYHFSRDREEISIGKVKLLRIINRLSPGLADRIMRNA